MYTYFFEKCGMQSITSISESHLGGEFDGAGEVCNGRLRKALAEVDVAQVGVGAGAVRLLLQHDLEEALRLLPPLLRRGSHTCRSKEPSSLTPFQESGCRSTESGGQKSNNLREKTQTDGCTHLQVRTYSKRRQLLRTLFHKAPFSR